MHFRNFYVPFSIHTVPLMFFFLQTFKYVVVFILPYLEMGLPQLSTAVAAAALWLFSESRLFFHGDELADAEDTLRKWSGCFFEADDAEDGLESSCGWFSEGELLEPWMGASPMFALWLLLLATTLSVVSSLSGWNLGLGGGFGASC